MQHRESSLALRFICRKILLKCTVIVTSRSYASESIMRLNGNYRHFEVIGFGEEEVHKVIAETLQDDGQLASDLVKELESQSNIKSLCYIPLVFSMVIQVYKKAKHLPSRLTELYDKFVLFAVKRHVKNSLTVSTDPKWIQSLKQLPPCIAPSFNKLCHFAYLSLKENNPRMTFTLPELQEALDVSITEGYIGLMTTVSVYDEELYQFPHLTIQEFLAAWWIANNDGMDVKAFEEQFEDDHFRMCLRFVAGLTGLKDEKFMDMKYFNIQLDLHCTMINDKHPCRYSLSTDIPQRLLHLLYESNNTDLCKHMANIYIGRSVCFEKFAGKHVDSSDIICMFFFLRSSGITWNKVHLRINEWGSSLPGLIMADDNSIDVVECEELIIDFIEVFDLKFIEPGFLDKVLCLFPSDIIVYCKCEYCYCFGETLIALLEKPQIKGIEYRLIGPQMHPARLDKSIHTRSSINVESLPVIKKLLETTITLEKLKINISQYFSKEVTTILTLSVIDGVMRNKSIKSLEIDNSSSNKELKLYYSAVSRNFEQLLKDNTTLEEIEFYPSPYDISEINAPLRSVKCSWLKRTGIESVLTRCQHLKSLNMDVYITLPPPAVRILITNIFNHLPKLSKLNVHHLGDSELWVELFTILQTNQTLEELRICDKTNIMNDHEVLRSLRNCLILNTSIKQLRVFMFKPAHLNYPLYISLTEGLSNNKTIEQLSLWSILINTDEGRSLLNAIFKMETLISLESNLHVRLECKYVDGVNLFPMISSLLHQNSHIKELHITAIKAIDMSHFSEHHFEEFLKTIYNHPTLEYVHFEFSSCIQGIAEHLYKKQISNCISPHTKIPPLIELLFF